jgi:amino acid adenylation domain-containing protein/non-ribosomal peptide synthase protein (TIGR01720 family)
MLPVHELVLRAVPNQPDAQAVDAWDGQLTYQELDDLSTLFALRLLDAGVRAQETVALCFAKSVHTPVAMLGVMKAGAIQVVLDVKQPADRLKAILIEIDEPLIICPETKKSLATDLGSDGRVLVLDNNRLKSMETPSHNVLPEVDPKSLLYMIFTSGSTGRPKGVVVSHANVSSALIHQESTREMDHNTRTLDFTSYGFDAAYFSLCHTLHSGGCVCVPSDNQRLNDVGGAIRDLDATCALLPPSLLNSVDETDILRLKTIYLGGEPVPKTLIEKWHDKTHISIVYGPTETTIITSYWPTRIPVPSSGMLGKPSGLKAWIVDISGACLVGVNAVGEMWLEGPLVSQGYLKNPEQTNHAFIENPAWLVAGTTHFHGRHGRLYRTGDLVRYNEDGSLSFVGRKSGYVKIRGQRVDLGEVEHHVRQTLQEDWDGDGHWAIVAEVITPRDSNRKMLVVFASPPRAASFTEDKLESEVRKLTAKLNDRLSLRLPSYMVPSAYTPVTAIPLTATGKPDRRKLRKILESQTAFEISAISDVIISPKTPIEAMIRDIWASVLNLAPDSISITANFLEIGGDSITAMQISSRCNSSNVPVSVREILNQKTIQKIAALSIKSSPQIREIHSEHPDGELVGLSPIQRWFFDRHPHGNSHFNQAFLFKLKSGITVDDIYNASRAVVSRHAMLRSQFARLEKLEWHQRILSNSDNAFLFREHRAESLEEVERISQHRQKTLNISDGYVFSVDVFNGSSNDLSVLFTAHHLVVDLVSWRIIWQDMEEYIKTKKPLEKTPSFLTWTLLQEEQAQSMTVKDVLPSKIKIQEDIFWGVPLSSNVHEKALFVKTSLDEEETTLLLGKSNDVLNTDVVDIMLATLKWTFEETFPDREIPPIFLEGHGREHLDAMTFDLSEIVGWFTSIYPIQIEKEPTILETIGAMKDYRKSIPSNGREYFAYRYHNEAGRKTFESHGHAEISFNYTGRFQQLEQSKSIFQPIILNLKEVSADSARLALIEINAGIFNKKLHISISRHRDMNHGERLDNWFGKFRHALDQVSHMLKDCDKIFTPSDFPLLHISRGSLKLALSDLANAGVPPSNIRDIYPATPIQNGIILSTKKQTASYQNSWVWKCLPSKFGEPVSAARLEKAWKLACQRHSILSTIFTEHPETGHSMQVLLHDAPIYVIHLKSESNAPELLLKDLKPHTLPVGKPPYSLTICCGVQGELACRLDMSHALIDASALGILVGDVMKIYSNKPLAPAPAFKQVVERIQSRPDREILEYWKNYLNGIQPCELPGVTSIKTTNDATYGRIILSTTTTDKIEKFCKERQITRSMLLQVAWALMLSSFTSGDEACFGYLSSGRDMEYVGQVVGPSISLMVSRISLTESLDNVISRVYRDSTQHFDYQHVSLAEVIHGLNLRGRRLFNTALSIRQEDSYQDDDSNEIRFSQTYGEDPHEVKADVHSTLYMLT